MRRYRLWSALLVIALAGCSLVGSSSTSESSAIPGESAHSGSSSIKFRTLYRFGYHQSDGVHPRAALYSTASCTQTCQENIYGTTAAGGTNNAGIIYDVSTDDLTIGNFDESTVMNFSPAGTGSDPTGSVIRDKNGFGGSLLTTASRGGAHDKGTVVKLRGAGSVLSFAGHNGAFPTSGLTAGPRQRHGYLFYTTTSGGGAQGLGAILAIRLSNNRLTPKILYSFSGKSDGAHPNSQLVGESSFIGTTSGSKDVAATVYEFTPGQSSTPTTLYTFENSADGAEPTGVIEQSESSVPVLYGTTIEGGSSGYGTLYELKQTGSQYTKVTLHTFAGGSADGAYPQGPPSYRSNGTFSGFYGVTEKGGSHNCGTIFRYDLDSGNYAVVYSFKCGKDGAYPEAPLASGADGLCGTTSAGGFANKGTVFTFRPF